MTAPDPSRALARMATAALSGLLFGAGLIAAGMVSPAKVLAFLDITGAFDPSLIVVMAAAMMTAFVGYRLVFRRGAPLFAARFMLPDRTAVDGRLLAGAAIFGIGWGLSGFCPGPAMAAILFGEREVGLFLMAMVAGMTLHSLVPAQPAPR